MKRFRIAKTVLTVILSALLVVQFPAAGFAEAAEGHPVASSVDGATGQLQTAQLQTQASAGSSVRQVALGSGHSAAVRSDGSLWTWGNNYGGCLGDGSYDECFIPQRIMDDVAQVSIGPGGASAAVKTDGTLWTWGWTVGDGTSTTRSRPTKIMDNVSQVVASNGSRAAIKTDGSLWMWGSNEYGQIGDGTASDRYSPVKVMDDVAQVSLGYGFSAAVKTDGTLWTWGNNAWGQLGDGTRSHRHAPEKIMDGVSQVSLGYQHAAALKTDGTLWTWGFSWYGILGDGVDYPESCRPTPSKMLDGVSKVTLGTFHSAAIKTDGSLWIWGLGDHGALGNGVVGKKGVIEDAWTPVKVMDGVVDASMGWECSAAIKPDGSLWTWGCNEEGTLGDGITEDELLPVCIYSAGEWLTRTVTKSGPVSISKDTWGFKNLGAQISLPICMKMLGSTYGYEMYKQGAGTGGLCYGMATTAADVSVRQFPAVNTFIDTSSSTVTNALSRVGMGWANPDYGLSSALDYIKYAWLAQCVPSMSKEMCMNTNRLGALVSAVKESAQESSKGEYGGPIVIGVYGEGGGHALLPVGYVESPEYTDVLVYDCNHPGEQRTLRLWKVRGTSDYTTWSYLLFDGVRWGTFYDEPNAAINWSTPATYMEGRFKDTGFGLESPISSGNAYRSLLRVNADVQATLNGSDYSLHASDCYSSDDLLSIPTVNMLEGEAGDESRYYWTNIADDVSFAGFSEGADFSIVNENEGVDVSAANAESASVRFDSEGLFSLDVAQASDQAFAIDFFECEESVELSAPEEMSISGQSAGALRVTQTDEGVVVSGVTALTVSDVDGESVRGNLNGEETYVIELDNEDGVPPSIKQADSDPDASVPMHRLYNPNSGEHFYTASDAERDFLVSVGWNSEGEGWTAPVEGAPVYRLYNPNAGDHHYTRSAGERDVLVGLGWSYEGEGWKTAGDDGVPLYRLYNPNAEGAGSHHYTKSAAERDFLVGLGWNAEGIGWFGV